MKIYTIVGARPNFLKIDPELNQTIVHTGQHYDKNMSEVFFKGLNLPKPKYNLGCKGHEVGKMLDKLMTIFQKDKPDMVIVFGDTNSSLAGALAARYEKIPLLHVESGMRSGTDMPEEINRIVIDHISTIRACSDGVGLTNLHKEGLVAHSEVVGDPMIDTMMRLMPIPKAEDANEYILVTIHRQENSSQEFFDSFFKVLADTDMKYKFPAHPRVKQFLKNVPDNVKIMPPQDYKKMISLIANAKKVITDSGGVQREGAWLNTPVIVMRKETEWENLINSNRIVLSDLENLKGHIENFKVLLTGAPMPGANEKIKKLIYKYI